MQERFFVQLDSQVQRDAAVLDASKQLHVFRMLNQHAI
jgi:hypothetical protein